MDLDLIIDKLGGEASVARELRCGVSAISNWKARGIPPGRRFDLLALAERKRVELTIPDVEEANQIITERRLRDISPVSGQSDGEAA